MDCDVSPGAGGTGEDGGAAVGIGGTCVSTPQGSRVASEDGVLGPAPGAPGMRLKSTVVARSRSVRTVRSSSSSSAILTSVVGRSRTAAAIWLNSFHQGDFMTVRMKRPNLTASSRDRSGPMTTNPTRAKTINSGKPTPQIVSTGDHIQVWQSQISGAVMMISVGCRPWRAARRPSSRRAGLPQRPTLH